MRIVAALLLVVCLPGLAGCSDDDSGELDALVALLPDDAEVRAVVPGLAPKDEYSTGESYGLLTDEERAGPLEAGTAGVARQWSRDAAAADEGEVWSVISAVVEFPTASEAAAAGDAVLATLPEGTTTVDDEDSDFRTRLTPPDDGISSGVAVATDGARLITLEAAFVGRADPPTFTGLVAAAAAPLA